MPDATPRFCLSRLPLFLVLALLPCLLSNSCASSTSSRATASQSGKKLSASAEVDYHFLVYQDLLRQGKKQEATAALEALAHRSPSPELAVELANLQWGQNQRAKATDTLEKALAAFPDARELTFYLANAYQMRRMTDQASQTLQRFLKRHPKDGPAVRELASVMLDVGHDKEAAALLGQLSEADRGATGFFLLAKAQSGMGDTAAAIRSLRAAVKHKPDLMPAWADLAALLEQTGDLTGAEDCYRKMLARGDATGEVRARLIRLAIKRKDPTAAGKLLATGKRDKAFLLSAMSAFIEAKYVKQAKQALALLTTADPDNPELLFYRAVLAYEGQNNPRAAMRILAKVPPSNPNFDKSYAFRIQIAMEIGKTAQAEALVREARKRFPDKKEFVVADASIRDKLGQTPEAARILKKALVTWPDDIDLLYRYGVALEKLKRRDEARKIMAKIVTLDPKNPDALNYLGYSLAEEGRDLDRAVTMISTALEKEPDNPFFLDSLAWALFKLNRSQEALTTIQKAIAHKVRDAIIWEHYGDIAAAAGHKAEASKAYRTALELGSETPDAVRKKLEAL